MAKLDPSVISALLGAMSALGGVVIGSVIEWLRTRGQNRHEAKQKELERKLTIKREIYLGAVEGVMQTIRYLRAFTDMAMSHKDHQALLSGYDAAMAKLHVVADFSTVSKAIHVNEQFSAVSLQLHSLRLPIIQKRAQLDLLTRQVQEDLEAQRALLPHFEQLLKTNPPAPQLVHIAEQLRVLNEKIKQAQTERQQLETQVCRENLNLHVEVQNRIRAFSKVLVELNIEVRKELELSFGPNSETYGKLIQESNEKISQRLSEYLDAIKKSSIQDDKPTT